MKDLPRLALLPGQATAAEVADLFRHLTGREPTPEEMEAVRVVLAGRQTLSDAGARPTGGDERG